MRPRTRKKTKIKKISFDIVETRNYLIYFRKP